MNIRSLVYGLLRDAYSIASGGVGTQKYFLDTLVLGREAQEFEELLYYCSSGSNLLASIIVLDTLYPRRKDAVYASFFGNKASHIRRKAKSMQRQEKEITNILLRSLINDSFRNDPKDLDAKDYMQFFSGFQRDYVATESPKKAISFDDIAPRLVACNNIFSLDKLLHKEELEPSQEFYEKLMFYAKDSRLKTRQIEYHADKLELMVDIVEYSIEIARKKGVKVKSTYRPYMLRIYPEHWEDIFEEKPPTLKRLIEDSRKSIQSARRLLSLHG